MVMKKSGEQLRWVVFGLHLYGFFRHKQNVSTKKLYGGRATHNGDAGDGREAGVGLKDDFSQTSLSLTTQNG